MRKNTWDESHAYSYEDRSRFLGKLVDFSQITSLLDLGCGEQTFLKENKIPKNVKYTGVDLYKHCKTTIVKDFNKHEKIGLKTDIAICAGVFEYIYDLPFLIDDICKNSKAVIATYWFAENLKKRPKIWVNAYNKKELYKLFEKNGFKLKFECFFVGGSEKIIPNETIFIFSKYDDNRFLNSKFIKLAKNFKYWLYLGMAKLSFGKLRLYFYRKMKNRTKQISFKNL